MQAACEVIGDAVCKRPDEVTGLDVFEAFRKERKEQLRECTVCGFRSNLGNILQHQTRTRHMSHAPVR